MSKTLSFVDALYGEVTLDRDIAELVRTPVVQRLRHIRLSNIDSVNMPGIANISRYEHALGVGYLAAQTAVYRRLPLESRLALGAAAVLHDMAITAFGHLVEEAFQYVGAAFDHEKRLYEMLAGVDENEIGGVDKQIIYGRQTNLSLWAAASVGADGAEGLLCEITKFVQGAGRFGPMICGDIDLDNIDGVFRMAYHMGLGIERAVPARLASAMVDVEWDTGEVVFEEAVRRELSNWVETREAVYSRLMLAEVDFVGKLMMLYATVRAYENREVEEGDWIRTDEQLLGVLASSKSQEIRETVKRWLVGEFWDATPVYWMSGERPAYTDLWDFSEALTSRLGRRCFAYGIRDKRRRRLDIRFGADRREQFGVASSQWLLGVGSPVKRPFKVAEIRDVVRLAESHFGTSAISSGDSTWPGKAQGSQKGWLL